MQGRPVLLGQAKKLDFNNPTPLLSSTLIGAFKNYKNTLCISSQTHVLVKLNGNLTP